MKAASKSVRRKFDDTGGNDIEQLRGQLTDLIASADEGQLRKLADFLMSEDFDDDSDASLATGATSNLPGDSSATGFRDKRHASKFSEGYEEFSERQAIEMQAIDQHLQSNRMALERNGGGPISDQRRVFADAVKRGARASDLLQGCIERR